MYECTVISLNIWILTLDIRTLNLTIRTLTLINRECIYFQYKDT